MIETIYAKLTARHGDFTPGELADAAGIAPEVARNALTALVSDNRAVALTDGSYLSDLAAERLESTARRLLAAHHRKNPQRRGMPKSELRAALAKAATCRDADALLAFLTDRGEIVVEADGAVRAPDHEIVLPAAWRAPAAEIAAVYASAGLQPPAPTNFQAHYPRDVHVGAILAALAQQGILVPLTDRLYLHRDTVEAVRQTLRHVAQTQGEITVGAARDALASSRKIVLPLLEYLDATGFTLRNGETHILR